MMTEVGREEVFYTAGKLFKTKNKGYSLDRMGLLVYAVTIDLQDLGSHLCMGWTYHGCLVLFSLQMTRQSAVTTVVCILGESRMHTMACIQGLFFKTDLS